VATKLSIDSMQVPHPVSACYSVPNRIDRIESGFIQRNRAALPCPPLQCSFTETGRQPIARRWDAVAFQTNSIDDEADGNWTSTPTAAGENRVTAAGDECSSITISRTAWNGNLRDDDYRTKLRIYMP